MNDSTSKKTQSLRDEVETLRARVEELEAAQIKESEVKELTKEVRSAGEKTSKTIIYLVIAVAFGSIIGNFLKSPPPTATERLCADYNIKC